MLSSAYFGDAVTDHVSRGSVLFFGFPDFAKKTLNPLNLGHPLPWGSALPGASLVKYPSRRPSFGIRPLFSMANNCLDVRVEAQPLAQPAAPLLLFSDDPSDLPHGRPRLRHDGRQLSQMWWSWSSPAKPGVDVSRRTKWDINSETKWDINGKCSFEREHSMPNWPPFLRDTRSWVFHSASGVREACFNHFQPIKPVPGNLQATGGLNMLQVKPTSSPSSMAAWRA